jgi:hypothetical protein
MMTILRQASIFALLSLLVAVVPLVMSVVYVARPTEQHLALMRPLSLAGLFAAMGGGVLGAINVLSIVWMRDLDIHAYHAMAAGAAESLIAPLVGFSSLTLAWLLVAVGMGRRA